MAKGNLFLGLGRGSVGDVTFYRKNGEQISRVHTKSVRNPNTDGQLIQRAILATISKAYAAGSAIFDHSFEGCSVGAACQAKFQRENLRILRSAVSFDLDNNRGDGDSTACVVARGGAFPVANSYRVSMGSLVQDVFTIAEINDEAVAKLPEARTNETIGAYCVRLGLNVDDIFTIVVFGITDSNYSSSSDFTYRTPWETHFGFIRLSVTQAAMTSTTLCSEADYTDIFDIDASFPVEVTATLDEHIGVSDVIPHAATGSIGVIRSRDNEGLRSVCDMQLPGGAVKWGIESKYLTEFWNPSAEILTQSPLILEGGDLNLGR